MKGLSVRKPKDGQRKTVARLPVEKYERGENVQIV